MKKFILAMTLSLVMVSSTSVAFANNDMIIDDQDNYPSYSHEEETVFEEEVEEEESNAEPAEENTATQHQTEDKKDYTAGLFVTPEIKTDNKLATSINNKVSLGASTIVSVILGALPSLVVASVAIDVACILFKPINKCLATMVPIQLFSDEVVSITGIAHSAGGDGSGGGASKVDLKGQNPLFYYAREKIVTVALALLILVFMGSGLWFDFVRMFINAVLGAVSGGL